MDQLLDECATVGINMNYDLSIHLEEDAACTFSWNCFYLFCLVRKGGIFTKFSHNDITHTHTQTFIPKIYLKHKNRPNHLKKAFDCFFYASVRFCISFICILNLRSKQTALINSKWITTFSCDYFSWFRSEDNGWQRSDLKANQVNSNKWRNSNTLKSPEAP